MQLMRPQPNPFRARPLVQPRATAPRFERLEPRTLFNVAPAFEVTFVDLNTWTQEDLSPGSGDWDVTGGGLTVTQNINGNPTVYYGTFDVQNVPLEGGIKQTGASDDDFIGFVIGFEPGDLTNPAADFLLIDWKMQDQGAGEAGLSVSRVSGVNAAGNYWNHDGDIVELARGNTLGSTGWARNTDYNFAFDYTDERLRVWVNDTLEIDLAAPGGDPFPQGRLGFYNYSQDAVVYSAFEINSVIGTEGSPVSLNRDFADADVGDTHTATIDWGDGAISNATVNFAGGIGTISDTHTYSDDGNFTITVTLDDGTDTAQTLMNGVISNVDPVANDDAAATDEDTPVSGTITHTDVDDDTISYTVAADPADGSLIIDALGNWTYTPDADFNGADSFGITVMDDDGGSDTATVNVTVNPVNDAPVANAGNASGDEDDTTTGTVTSSDVDAGDSVSYSIASQPTNGSVTIDAGTGAFTYTPDTNFNGSDSFTFTATDGSGLTDTATISLTINPINDPPTADAGTALSMFLGGSVTLNAAGSRDIDGDNLSYAWDIDGDGDYDDATGRSPTLLWTELEAAGITLGDYTIGLRVSDPSDETDTDEVSLSVAPVPEQPETSKQPGGSKSDDDGLPQLIGDINADPPVLSYDGRDTRRLLSDLRLGAWTSANLIGETGSGISASGGNALAAMPGFQWWRSGDAAAAFEVPADWRLDTSAATAVLPGGEPVRISVSHESVASTEAGVAVALDLLDVLGGSAAETFNIAGREGWRLDITSPAGMTRHVIAVIEGSVYHVEITATPQVMRTQIEPLLPHLLASLTTVEDETSLAEAEEAHADEITLLRQRLRLLEQRGETSSVEYHRLRARLAQLLGRNEAAVVEVPVP